MRETSMAAWTAINSGRLLPRRRLEAYNFLYQLGGSGTSGEVMEFAKNSDPSLSQTYLNNIDKRLSELRDTGVTREAGRKVCPITGQTRINWTISDELPVPLEKRKTNRQKISELTKFLSEKGLTEEFSVRYP